MTAAALDLETVAAQLRGGGFRLSVADDLRIGLLLERLGEAGLTGLSPRDQVSYLGPIVCRVPEDWPRLRELLGVTETPVVAPPPRDRTASREEPASTRTRAKVDGRSALGWRSKAKRFFSSTRLRLAFGAIGLVIAVSSLVWFGVRGSQPLATVAAPPPLAERPADPAVEAPAAAPVSRWPARLILGGVPFLLAVSYILAARAERRAKGLMRGPAPDRAERQILDLALDDEDLFARGLVAADLRDLRRHKLVESDELNINATLDRTVRSAGFVEFVHALRPAAPSYLVLVDRTSRDDHQGQFADLMVQRLRGEQVDLVRYDYRGDPRSLARALESGESEFIELETLRALADDRRLLIIADPASFWDPVRRVWRDWVEGLLGFEISVIVSPRPRNAWTAREQELAALGFDLIEATPTGLSELARRTRAEPASVRAPLTAQPSALDRRLANQPYRWLSDAAPRPDEISALLVDLKAALDAETFLHLCAVAVFPELQARLTIAVGRALRDGEGRPILTEARLADLSRLPWLRQGRIPDWLRLALVRDLVGRPKDEEKVRQMWAAALNPPDEAQEAARLKLDVAAIAGLQRGLAAVRSPTSRRETLLLDFLDRAKLPELAVGLDGRRATRAPAWAARDLWALGLSLTAALCLGALGGVTPDLVVALADGPEQAVFGWGGLGLAWLAVLTWTLMAVTPPRLPPWLPRALAAAGLILALLALATSEKFGSIVGVAATLIALWWCYPAPARPPPVARLDPMRLFRGDRSLLTAAVLIVTSLSIAWIGLWLVPDEPLLASAATYSAPFVCVSVWIASTYFGARLGLAPRQEWAVATAFIGGAMLSAPFIKEMRHLYVVIIGGLALAGLALWRAGVIRSRFVVAVLAMTLVWSLAFISLGDLDTGLAFGAAFILCLYIFPGGALLLASRTAPVEHPGRVALGLLTPMAIGAGAVLLFRDTTKGTLINVLAATVMPCFWLTLRVARPELWRAGPAPARSPRPWRAVALWLPIVFVVATGDGVLEELSLFSSPLILPFAAWFGRRYGWGPAALLIGLGGAPLLVSITNRGVRNDDLGLYLAALAVARLASSPTLVKACRDANTLGWPQTLVLLGPLMMSVSAEVNSGLGLGWRPYVLAHLLFLLVGVSKASLRNLVTAGGVAAAISIALHTVLPDQQLSALYWKITISPLLSSPSQVSTAALMLLCGRELRYPGFLAQIASRWLGYPKGAVAIAEAALLGGAALASTIFPLPPHGVLILSPDALPALALLLVAAGCGRRELIAAAGLLAALYAVGLYLSLLPGPLLIFRFNPGPVLSWGVTALIGAELMLRWTRPSEPTYRAMLENLVRRLLSLRRDRRHAEAA